MDIQRISANLPKHLLKEAQIVTGEGITPTLVKGLELLKRSMAYRQAQKLRGKLNIEINLEESRERARH